MGCFEHLHYPSVYFKEISRLLAPNGKFIFLVTNANSQYGKRAYREDVPRHFHHYSEQTLRQYADKYGFRLTRCIYNDDVYDGRGIGTFKYTLGLKVGLTLQEIFDGTPIKNKFQKRIMKFAIALDKFAFKTHWESKLKCSGTMIVEFMRK